MIAVYLAMLETDVDRDKFMKLYESYEKKLFAIALRILENKGRHEQKHQQSAAEGEEDPCIPVHG